MTQPTCADVRRFLGGSQDLSPEMLRAMRRHCARCHACEASRLAKLRESLERMDILGGNNG